MPKVLKDLPLKGKTVLCRVDFNVPMENGKITDDSRIIAALPTIQYVLNQGAALILMSRLGRPKGKKDPKFSLAPCAKRLKELLNKPVEMAPDCIGPEVEALGEKLQPGQVLLLENLRFYDAEEHPEKDPNFVKSLAKLGQVYVNDAFGTAHREHASTALIAHFFEAKAMGFLMEKEIKELSPLLKNPKRPFYAVIGGAKISSKIGVIKKLLELVDGLFIGGGMAFPFLKAEGIGIGDSICEDPEEIKDLPKEKIHLPLDLIIADRFSNDAKVQIIPVKNGIPPGWQGMDIGPETMRAWSDELMKAGTCFWNGPLGVFEMSQFGQGTKAIAECLSHASARTVIGGGDSLAAIQQLKLGDKFSHLSTGGGASLEFIEFGHLPGIDALN